MDVMNHILLKINIEKIHIFIMKILTINTIFMLVKC